MHIALVAQRIEHKIADLEVVGSIPTKRATSNVAVAFDATPWRVRIEANCPPKADLPWAGTTMYYVYVLQNKEGRLYRGSSADLKKRLLNHNSGKVRSTKKGRPWKLIYYEAFISKTTARKEELFLKSGKGRERLKLLIG